MGKLENDLPEITKTVLHDEDKVTKILVKTLLREVMVSQNKTDSYPAVRKILDDEIEKCITAGFIDLENLEAE